MHSKLTNRFISTLLTFTLLFSNTLVSFAGTEDHNAQGNDNKGIVTGKGGDFSANISDDYTSGKIGLRFSLVDMEDPTKILSVDDAGNPQVVDILYVTQEQFIAQTAGGYNSKLEPQFAYTSVKTQDNLTNSSQTGGDYPVIKRVAYDQINAMSQWTLEPWLQHNGAYYSTGSDFVAWCEKNDSGQNMSNGDGLLFTT